MPEAIILAGGLGTRLRTEVPDLPKCMAPVAGKPFLDYVIRALQEQGVTKFIFSLGYRSEVVLQHLEQSWPKLKYDYTIETIPLGTGGGIRFAVQKVKGDSFFVLNGDTYFEVNLPSMLKKHIEVQAEITVALKKMYHFDRYGSVLIGQNNIISAFQEKTYREIGWINGGIYLIQKQLITNIGIANPFSFEKEILEKYVDKNCIFGFESDGYFIDIGIPEDFKKANLDFAT
ncbi:MAG: nucleotidyltransferase family protein [Saprospiraceae bacterium]|nr:nucleotidyltransferase family protein [Saprospiraceae bacterium]